MANDMEDQYGLSAFPKEEEYEKLNKMWAGMDELSKRGISGKDTCGKKKFGFLLGAVSSMRKIPGINRPIAIDELYLCKNEEEKKEVLAYLNKLFGIYDYQTLIEHCNAQFDCGDNYEQFLKFWEGKAKYNLDGLKPEARRLFEGCMEYAAIFKDYVGTGGFYAWDCSEKIGVLKLAYACGIVEEEDFHDLVGGMMERVLSLYSSWKEYATGLICGASYFMYKRSNLNVLEGKKMFDLTYNIVQSLFLNDKINVWCRYQWLKAYK